MSNAPDRIINIAIAAHVDAGKTTLTEQMLYRCGVIRRAGRVDDGDTQTDRMEVERERGISVKAAVTALSWRDCAVNLIDTPGHADFAGEVERVLGAIDGAALVISAVEGIQSHTLNLWRAFEKLNIPCVIFINKLDRAGSRFDAIVKELNSSFSSRFIPLVHPVGEGGRDCSITAYPDREEMFAGAAELDDDIAAYYIGEKTAPDELLDKKFRSLVAERAITPVLCGAAALGIGITELLDAVISWLPRASEKQTGELAGYVFKLEHDREVGRVAYVRMYGGALKNRDTVFADEKVTQIRKWSGAKYSDTGEVGAGDIAALCGLRSARTGSAIGSYTPSDIYKLANPFLTVKVAPKDAAQLTALVDAARELSEEDPLINCRWEKNEREINIDLTGKIQSEIIYSLLLSRYGIDTVFSPPSVIYRETPSRAGEGFEAYTMPKPCWAVVRLGIEPLPRGSGVVYDGGRVPNNQLFYKYQEHIKTSALRTLAQGPLGWEVTDLKITLLGGEHHTIHTHPLDFFVATPMAMLNGLVNTGTTLLEPLLDVRITAPEGCLGRVLSDITNMRGEFDTPVIGAGGFTVDALLPVSSSLEYPVRLASMSGGKAVYSPTFHGYRECPPELGATAKYRGVCPLDRAKWILQARGAYTE